MPNRRLSFVLLFAVSFSFGGLGRYLHERDAVDGGDRGIASFTEAEHRHSRHDDLPAHRHDHQHCAVCQLLSAPGIDRLPGATMCGVVDPPTRTPPRDEPAPTRVSTHTTVDARGPPAGPLA